MVRRRSGFGVVAVVLSLYARLAAAQSAIGASPPLRPLSPAQPSFSARYADALGVGYRAAPNPRTAAPPPVTAASLRSHTWPSIVPPPPVASTRDMHTCPMPVATIAPGRVAPMPSAVIDTAADPRAAVAGRLLGCTNPLAP